MSPEISIVIKALNEERNIKRAIESSLAALKGLKGEVILADSLSTDRTVEIAKRFPVRIVQLTSSKDRSCGVGPQLGYQYAKGSFVYILDGDMALEKGFLQAAVERLRQDSKLAGVAGDVKEMHAVNIVFKRRKEQPRKVFGSVDRLEMGGLYRREALEQAGYFSNRNLHAYEEAELGLRLLAKGWHLERIKTPAIRHYGYNTTTFGVFARRWKTRYVKGSGEFLRAALKGGFFLRAAWHLKIYIWVIKWWLLLAICLALLGVSMWPLKALLALTALFLLAFVVKKKSIKQACFSLVSWHFSAIGMVWGLCSRQKDPREKIPSRVIT